MGMHWVQKAHFRQAPSLEVESQHKMTSMVLLLLLLCLSVCLLCLMLYHGTYTLHIYLLIYCDGSQVVFLKDLSLCEHLFASIYVSCAFFYLFCFYIFLFSFSFHFIFLYDFFMFLRKKEEDMCMQTGCKEYPGGVEEGELIRIYCMKTSIFNKRRTGGHQSL